MGRRGIRCRPRCRSRSWRRRPRGWCACRGARGTGLWPEPGSAAIAGAPRRRRGRLLAAFGPERFRIELQRPLWRRDRARNRWLASLAERLGVPCVATGDVHVHDRSRAHLQDALVAVRLNATLDETEARRRGNSAAALLSPAAGSGALSRPPRGGRRGRAAGGAAALRSHQRPRLQLSGRGGRERGRAARGALRARGCGTATERRAGQPRGPRHGRPAGGGGAAARRGAGPDQGAAALRLLPAPPRHARAGAGDRRRGARAGLGALAAAPRSRAAAPASARSSAT